MTAAFIKSSIINHLGFKCDVMCDEVGLPVLEEWGTTMFADVMEVKKNGTVIIYEVKSGVPDFKADRKWRNYLDHCHLLYFVADKKTIDYIEGEIPSNIGLYTVSDSGFMHIKRRAKNTKNNINSGAVKSELLRKVYYRFLKNWKKVHKDLRLNHD